MVFKNWLNIIKKLYSRLSENDISALAAQVTYYLILSFFPFMIFFVTMISYTKVADSGSMKFLSELLPKSVYTLISRVVQDVLAVRNKAFLSFGMLGTIWGASTGVLAIMRGINKAYKLKETRPFWKVRLLSIFFTIAFSMVLVFSFILVVLGEILGNHLISRLNLPIGSNLLWDIIRYITTIIIMLFSFILLYYYIPNHRLHFKDVIPGSLFTTIGWTLISFIFAFYVNNFRGFSYTYGSLGTIIALLIWLYWSSMIILIGNEVNALLLDS